MRLEQPYGLLGPFDERRSAERAQSQEGICDSYGWRYHRDSILSVCDVYPNSLGKVSHVSQHLNALWSRKHRKSRNIYLNLHHRPSRTKFTRHAIESLYGYVLSLVRPLVDSGSPITSSGGWFGIDCTVHSQG